MKTAKLTLSAVAAVALLAMPARALAQDPPPPPPQEQPPAQEPPAAQEPATPAAQTASGELVKVDTEGKTISIKSAAGEEMQFSYDDSTQVAGGGEGVAGLATKAGSQVTVEYTEDAGTKKATKIEVAS